jgi:signal transduction histidine kinase
MSHEMRTPLTVMSAYAQFAVEEIKENGANEQTLADLAAISGESRRLAEMADGTLKILLSETEAPPDEQKNFPVDIGEISMSIARLFEPVAKRNGRKLTAAIGRDIPRIPGDPGALTQLLWNILQNAIIHSQCKNIDLSVEASGLDVTITIRDDGCGINADILPHIFERGIGKQDGSGIGLSICREVARRHGGSIDIRCEQGEGTTVTVLLKAVCPCEVNF